MKTITVPLVVRLHNNQDGGYGIYVYGSQEEMLADHPMTKEFKEVEPDEWKWVTVELTEEQKQEILTEDDPYTNGYIDSATMTLNVAEDGSVTLAKPLHFHAGQ